MTQEPDVDEGINVPDEPLDSDEAPLDEPEDDDSDEGGEG